MNNSLFQDGGPLAADSPVYIPRQADIQALMRLRKMEYLLVTAPHQQGKTSLIGRIAFILQDENYQTILVQLNDLMNYKEEAKWYWSLMQIITDGLENILSSSVLAAEPTLFDPQITWRSYLRLLSDIAFREKINLIVALDEAGCVPKAWATNFFSSIRSLYNYRLTQKRYNHITFIVSGTFNPRHLIDNINISDFNVAHQILLDDFSTDQIQEQVNLIEGCGDAVEIAERIAYWTSGQPFMVQALCEILSAFPMPLDIKAVDKAVNQFINKNTQHLAGIFEQLRQSPDLINDLKMLLINPEKLAVDINSNHFHLTRIIGILADKETAEVRNRIYFNRLNAFLQFPNLSQVPISTGPNVLSPNQSAPTNNTTYVMNIQQSGPVQFSTPNQEEQVSTSESDKPSLLTTSLDANIIQQENSMDPVSIVISALLSGLVTGVSDTAKKFTGDIYETFKKHMTKRIETNDAAKAALQQVQKNPDSKSWQNALAEELSRMKLDINDELVLLAQDIMNTLNEKGVQTEIYMTNININNGPVVIGHKASVNQTAGRTTKKQ